MKRAISTLLGVLALCLFAEAHAAPTTMSFTGRLSNASGPFDGTIGAVFAIFDAPTGGAMVWTETKSLVADDGLVFADLGTTTPLDETIFDSQAGLYLQITINGEPLNPRLAIQSVPYAVTAASAESLGTIAPDEVVTIVTASGGGVTAMRAANTVNVGLTTCALGQILKAGAGGTWACAADGGASYTALANGGVAINASNQVGLVTCASGQVLKAGAGGTWACAADIDTSTTYSALANGGVAINASNQVGLVTCAAGQVLKAGAGGTWACAADADTNTTYTGTSPVNVSGTSISLVGDSITAAHIAPGGVGNSEVAAGAVSMSKLNLPAATAGLSQAMAASGRIEPAGANVSLEAAGQCLVTAHLSTTESGATGNVDVQVTRNGSLFGPEQALTTATGTTRYSAEVTAVVTVAAGANTFGCDVDLTGSFAGNSFTCTVTFFCFS